MVNLTETPWQPGAVKALELDGQITRLGEGSQAARAMFGLYGAGKARAQSDMVFTDAQTGRPLIVTADRRVAQMGMFGGDSKDHLRESFDDMARDLASWCGSAGARPPESSEGAAALHRNPLGDWSGRPDSNRRRPAWEAGILPLNYGRLCPYSSRGASRVKSRRVYLSDMS